MARRNTKTDDVDHQAPQYPWHLIELDYRAGVIPVAGISRKYGVSVGRLEMVARDKKWERRALTPDDVFGPRNHDSHPLPPGSLVTLNEDARRVAVAQVSAIQESHRSSIRKAKEVHAVLMERMLNALAGNPDVVVRQIDPPGTVNPKFEVIDAPWIGGRETPSDVLKKLTDTLFKLIGLERQSFGLDFISDPTDVPPEEANEELSRIEARLDAIAKSKTEAKETKT